MVEYEVVDNQPAEEIKKTRLMRKYFYKWLTKTNIRYLEKQYEILCGKTNIQYLNDHKKEVHLLGSSLVMIMGQLSMSLTSASSMIFTGLINSDIFYDILKYCIRRGLLVRHWFIQLGKMSQGVFSNLGKIDHLLPTISISQQQSKIFHKRFGEIWKSELIYYMKSIGDK